MTSSQAESQVDRLELRALEERDQLHHSVENLKTKVHETLDPARNVRKHFLGVSVVAAVISFVSGYSFGGIFTR
jgi:hypothetical protein